VLVYIVACVLMLPGSVLTMAAGAVFGVWLGLATVSVGSTLGACAAFLVGRFIARNWVSRWVGRRPAFAAIDRAVCAEGLKIVFLTRLSPLFPFNFQNYAYGLTGIPLWKYALASWTGMLPGAMMYVYIGSVLGAAAGGDRSRTPTEWVLYAAGLAATVVVTIFITRIARRALGESLGAENPGPQIKETP